MLHQYKLIKTILQIQFNQMKFHLQLEFDLHLDNKILNSMLYLLNLQKYCLKINKIQKDMNIQFSWRLEGFLKINNQQFLKYFQKF